MSSDAPAAEPEPAVSPLRVPIFRAVWLASIGSNFGAMIQAVGAAWMMTYLTNSPQMVALVQTSMWLPYVFLALWAGAVADNLDRRKVMLGAQLYMFVLSAILCLFAWEDWLTPWLLLVFTFLIGCGTVVTGPAWQASVGELVKRDQIPAAVSLNSMGFNIARTMGPAIGGAIVAAAGAALAFLVNTLSYVWLITVLLRWKKPDLPRLLPREGLFMAMGAGLRYVAMSPHVRTAVVRAAAFGMFASTTSALMPLIARDIIAGGPLTYGILLGSFGVGAVFGGLSIGPLRRNVPIELIIRAASLALAAGTAVAAVSPYLILTAAALLLTGACWVLALATFNITVQFTSPRWVVARALSVYQMTALGAMALGSWVLGVVAEYHGVSTALLIGAALQVGTMLIGFLLPLPQMDDLNLDPLSQWTEPDTAVQIEARSGPVVITIEYRIATENIVAFLTAMTERRRIRRRDGAHGWTLLRDLHDPELWIERYHVATWLDYIRHNHRRTQADVDSLEVLHGLQKPDAPMRVHRMIERQVGSLPAARRNDPMTIDSQLNDPTRTA